VSGTVSLRPNHVPTASRTQCCDRVPASHLLGTQDADAVGGHIKRATASFLVNDDLRSAAG
jgi:hypothetical protein